VKRVAISFLLFLRVGSIMTLSLARYLDDGEWRGVEEETKSDSLGSHE
jgi:hypothetical protein